MARSVVGLDFGTTSVRAVEVRGASGSRPQVRRFARESLPAGAIDDGEVVEPHTVADALKRLWKRGRFGTRNVAIGVGNQRVLTRPFTVDDAPIERVRESLPALVEEILPFPAEDALIDFYPVERHPRDPTKVNGLVVASAKHAVDEAVRALRLAKLKTESVDLIPFALSRVHLRGRYAQGTVALIDQGPSSTSVVIAVDGIPRFVRIIPSGDSEVTRMMMMRLDLSLEDITTQYLTRLRAEDPPEFSEAMVEAEAPIIRAANRTLVYWMNQNQAEIRLAVVTGRNVHSPAVMEAFREGLRVQSRQGDALGGVALHKSISTTEMQNAVPTVAIGLAMGGGSRWHG